MFRTHQNPVTVDDCVEPVSDGEDCALLELVPYGLLDEAVGSERARVGVGGWVGWGHNSSTQKALSAKQPQAGSLLNTQQWLVTSEVREQAGVIQESPAL